MTKVTIKLTMTTNEAGALASCIDRALDLDDFRVTSDEGALMATIAGELNDAADDASKGILGDFVWVSDSIGDDDE